MTEDDGGSLASSRGIAAETPLYRLRVIALDFETTGLAAHRGDAVCEVGLVEGHGEQVRVLFESLVDPERPQSAKSRELTGIDASDLEGAPKLAALIPEILHHLGDEPVVMHNAPFDLLFLLRALEEAQRPPVQNLAIDTLLMARFLDRSRDGNSLRQTAERYGIEQEREHRAAADAMTTARVYHALIPYLELRGVRTVGDLVRGRMAGRSPLFAARPSSLLLDLVSRAVETGGVVSIRYAARPGEAWTDRRIRVRVLEGDRSLIGVDLGAGEERTFRLDRILVLNDGRTAYVSPWAPPGDLPGSDPPSTVA